MRVCFRTKFAGAAGAKSSAVELPRYLSDLGQLARSSFSGMGGGGGGGGGQAKTQAILSVI